MRRFVDNSRMAITALVSCSLLLVSSIAWSEEPPPFLLKWGSQGSGNGQFSSPAGIDFDNDGNIYVVDGGGENERVQKFTPNGGFIMSWGEPGSGLGQFDHPIDIAIDHDQNVFVTDQFNHRVQKFATNGSFLSAWGSPGTGNGQFESVAGIAVDSDGNVFVSDVALNRIQKFTNDGVFLTAWGSFGTGEGQFRGADGLAVDDDGNVYVADPLNHRIQKFTNAGVFIASFGEFGDTDGRFNLPRGVAVDLNGNLYVSDDFNARIQKFTNNGVFLTTWGTFGSGEGEFNGPYDLTVDSNNNVYVTDSGNKRIQKFGIPPFTIESVTASEPRYSWNHQAELTVTLHSNSASGSVQVTPTVTLRDRQSSLLPGQAATLSPGQDEEVVFQWELPNLVGQVIIDVNVSVNGGSYGAVSASFEDVTVVNELTAPIILQAQNQIASCGTTAQETCMQNPMALAAAVVPYLADGFGALSVAENACLAKQYEIENRSLQSNLMWLAASFDAVDIAISRWRPVEVLIKKVPVLKVLPTALSSTVVCWVQLIDEFQENGAERPPLTRAVNAVTETQIVVWADSLQQVFVDAEIGLADLALTSGFAQLQVEADSTSATADTTGLKNTVILRVRDGQCAAIRPEASRLFGEGTNPTSAATIKLLADTTGTNTFILFHRQASGEVIKLEYAPILLEEGGSGTLAVSQDSTNFPLLVDQNGDGNVDFHYYPGGAVVSVPGDGTTASSGLFLAPPLPNPSSKQTFLRYSLPRESDATLTIYNVGGRKIRGWKWLKQSAGTYQVAWDGRDDSGQSTPPGVYFYRLSVNGQHLKQKLIHL